MDKKRIELRQAELERVSQVLKNKFIGIDIVVDRIIDNISLWYIMPELQLRPMIVSLWGITGVGKTDLVRTLIRELKMSDVFVEIQMDATGYNDTIEGKLQASSIHPEKPSVLLLDEIQRYRTIDEEGKMISVTHYTDLWMLLSDGCFKTDSRKKKELIEAYHEQMYYAECDAVDAENARKKGEVEDDEAKAAAKKMQYKLGMYTARSFKRLLSLPEPVGEIMQWPKEKCVKLLKESTEDDSISDAVLYSKMLIFISGNLDEAFTMSGATDNDISADIYNEMSKEISITNIKKALRSKFKPEQIARFGNNHVIYPILSVEQYEQVIQRYSGQLLSLIKEKHGINVTLTNNVYDAIYRNGVTPTQGVRPTITSINSIIGSNIPHFVYHAFVAGLKEITVDIVDDVLTCEVTDTTITKRVDLDIDKVKEKRSEDDNMLVLVHELGHAFIQAMLIGKAPRQINLQSLEHGKGFVFNNVVVHSTDILLKTITMTMGGLAAELVVFGKYSRSSGSSSDIHTATVNAANYVRKYGMDKFSSYIQTEGSSSDSQATNFNVESTNSTIEGIVCEERNRAVQILKTNSTVFKALINRAIKDGFVMEPETLIEVCADHGIKVQEPGEVVEPYVALTNEYLNSK